MPNNEFSIWSESIDIRSDKKQKKEALTDADTKIIERIIQGDKSKGIHLHALAGTNPTVYAASVTAERRLLFITRGSTLALIGITQHKYDTANALQPGVAEMFYQKPWSEIKNKSVIAKVTTPLADFTPTPDYQYQAPDTCVRYHGKFIVLDDKQEKTLELETPVVIVGDPGSGKSSLCSVGMDDDLRNRALLEDNRFIVYFTESSKLAPKMERDWLLDHPLSARLPEANQLLFMDYARLLAQFGPKELQDKRCIGEAEFEVSMGERVSNKVIRETHAFINTKEFKTVFPTFYHEIQLMAACLSEERYSDISNLPKEMRSWAYAEFKRYLENLAEEGQCYDPNLLVWKPAEQPFSRVYHDEALSAPPVMSLMLHRLTKNANIVYFADPNQDNNKKRRKSCLNYLLRYLGVDGGPATKAELGVTYRLPPTIADLANEILAIKQNVNGGLNEKAQSSRVQCLREAHVFPGTLEWVRHESIKNLVEKLNNQVYVVITHPEYVEDAKKEFGREAVVCTVDEARGLEFENAVLYRVTNPQSEHKGKGHQRKEENILQLLCKKLATLPLELENKPNLAKGESDRRFEAYMNGIYIAASRIIRCGYIVEKGDPRKNELHKRLMACIDKSMKNCQVKETLSNVSEEMLLEKARRDLMEGNTIQAKAAFLKAGKSELEFEAEQAAQEERNTKLIEDSIKARNSAQVAPNNPRERTRASAQPKSRKNRKKRKRTTPSHQSEITTVSSADKKTVVKVDFAAMVREESTDLLKQYLSDKAMYSFFNISHNGPSVLEHIFNLEKLRLALIDFFNEKAEYGEIEDLVLFMTYNNFNQKIKLTIADKKTIEISIMGYLIQHAEGRKLVRNMLEYDPITFMSLVVLSMTQPCVLLEDGAQSSVASLYHYLADSDRNLYMTFIGGISDQEGFVSPDEVVEGMQSTDSSVKIMRDKVNHYRALLKKPSKPMVDQLLAERTVVGILNGDEETPEFFHKIIGDKVLKPLFVTAISDLVEQSPNHRIFNFFTKKVLSKLILVDDQYISLLLLLMQTESGRKIVDHLEKHKVEFYARLPGSVFFEEHAIKNNEHRVSILFIMSHLRLDSFEQAWRQNKAIRTSDNDHYFTRVYTLKTGAKRSVIGNLILAPSAFREKGSGFFEKIAKESHFFKKISYRVWLEKNIQINEKVAPMSLFDLMLVANHPLSFIRAFIETYKANMTLDFVTETIEYNNTQLPRLFYLAGIEESLTLLSNYVKMDASDNTADSVNRLYAALAKQSTDPTHVRYMRWNTIARLSLTSPGRLLFIKLLVGLPDLLKQLKIQDFQHPHDIHNMNIVFSRLICHVAQDRKKFVEYIAANEILHHYVKTHESLFLQKAQAAFSQFVSQCERSSNQDCPRYCEPATETRALELTYLLKQTDAAARFSQRLPNGKTAFGMALGDVFFCNIFTKYLTDIINRYGTTKQARLIVDFFNKNALHEPVLDGNMKLTMVLNIIAIHPNVKEITAILYQNENSNYCYKHEQLDLHYWLKPFFQFDPHHPATVCSHLDLLMCTDGLAEMAKNIISRHLRSFMTECFNEAYLFHDLVFLTQTRNRITQILTHEALHHVFLFYLKQAKPPFNQLVQTLMGALEKDQPEMTLIKYLSLSTSGCKVLTAIHHKVELKAAFNEETQAWMASIANAQPSVTTPLGLFSSLPLALQELPAAGMSGPKRS